MALATMTASIHVGELWIRPVYLPCTSLRWFRGFSPFCCFL